MEELVDIKKQFELIGKIPNLKNYSFENRQTLSHMGKLKKFLPKETIIKQGELNLTLLFLIRGKVDIVLDGQYITSFQGGGKLFGEMSFVNHTTATANVMANTEATFLTFDIPTLFALNEPNHMELLKNLYHSIAEILAQKLISTNEMAKSYQAEHSHEDLD